MKITLLPVLIFIHFSLFGNSFVYENKKSPIPLNELGELGIYLKNVHQQTTFRSSDSSAFYLNLAEQTVDINSPIEQTLFYYYKVKCNLTLRNESIDSIKAMCLKGIELSKKENFTYYEAHLYNLLKSCYVRNSKEYLNYGNIALNLSLTLDDKMLATNILFTLVIDELSNDKIIFAKKHLKEIKMILEEDPSSPPIRWLKYYIFNGQVSSNFDTTAMYLDSAMTIIRNPKYKLVSYGPLLEMERVDMFQRMGRNDLAKKHILESERLADSLGITQKTYHLDLKKHDVYVALKEYKKAKFHFERYEKQNFSQELDPDSKYSGYNLYKALNDTAKAFAYLEEYFNYINRKNKLNAYEKDSLYIEYQNKYHLEKIKTESLLKDKKIEKTSFRNTLITITSLFVIIILSLYFIYKSKKSKQKLLTTSQILKKEKEINDLRKRFIENITHEIRSPLTMISGIFEFLGAKIQNPNLSNLIEIGQKNSIQLKQDTEHILELMKSEPHTKTVHSIKTYLKSFFLNILEHYKLNIFSKNITINFQHNLNEKTYVIIDANKMATIFTNYLTNAIKFSYPNSIININLECSKVSIKFSVENFGFEIPEEEKDRVFKRYYQSEQQTSGGHGIGLSIVKELSDLLNAQVGIESNSDNKSTLFYCLIPIHVYHSMRTTQFVEIKNSNNPIQYETDSSLRKHKLLVIDDNELMIEFYKTILNQNFECEYAFNGNQALQLMQKNIYDCILSDVMMPQINGIQLLQKIKDTYPNFLIPIIFITAKNFEETRLEAFRIGVHDFISKPFIIKELITRIQNVIRNNENRTQTIAHKDEVLDELPTQVIIPQQDDLKPLEYDEQLLKTIIKLIDKNLEREDFNIESLATDVFYSKRQLTRKTIILTGLPPGKLILERRLLKAYNIIKEKPNSKVSEIQRSVGIKSPSYFNKVFKERFGITPGNLKNTG